MTGRTILPVIESVYDKAFRFAPPAPGPIPAVEYRRLTLNGETYQLKRIVMPDGEIRKSADQFTGHGDTSGLDPMRFGCAWTPAPIIRGL